MPLLRLPTCWDCRDAIAVLCGWRPRHNGAGPYAWDRGAVRVPNQSPR